MATLFGLEDFPGIAAQCNAFSGTPVLKLLL
jgi:hypothetical protein